MPVKGEPKPTRRGVYKCVLPERLKPTKKDKGLSSERQQPLSLAELCDAVLSAQPLPRAWHWDAVMVSRWVARTLRLPQYKNCFLENYVDGRKLLRIEADVLPKMNIVRFDHIQLITAAIRKLFGLEFVLFERSISLVPRYPEPTYLFFRAPTGPARECVTRLDLYRAMGMAMPAKSHICALLSGTADDQPGRRVQIGLFNKTRLAGPHTSLAHLLPPSLPVA